MAGDNEPVYECPECGRQTSEPPKGQCPNCGSYKSYEESKD